MILLNKVFLIILVIFVSSCSLDKKTGIWTKTKKIAKEALQLRTEEKEIFLKKYSISLKRKIWKRKHGGGLWDADHIIPVKDGGGSCGLENIRTLCIKCHKVVTKESYSKD